MLHSKSFRRLRLRSTVGEKRLTLEISPPSLSLSLADDTNPCPHRRTFWHLCPRGGRLGLRFEADYAPFVGRQEASRNGSRLSAGRVSAAAMTVLSVHLYHRRSLDIVLTSDKG